MNTVALVARTCLAKTTFTQKDDFLGKRELFQGANFEDTRDLGAVELKFFIERDIYHAIKNGELPNLETKISFKKGPRDRIKIFLSVRHLSNFEVVGAEEKLIQDKITEIISSYNFERLYLVDGEILTCARRFDFEISFTPSIPDGSDSPNLYQSRGAA